MARQYCGQLGKRANCQSLVSLTLAQGEVPVPVGLRLFLPDEWVGDAECCARAGVQLRAARAAGIQAEVALLDAGYGNDTDLRDGVTGIGLPYVVGIQSSISLWPPRLEPLPSTPWSARGRPPSGVRRDDAHQPVSAKQLAQYRRNQPPIGRSKAVVS